MINLEEQFPNGFPEPLTAVEKLQKLEKTIQMVDRLLAELPMASLPAKLQAQVSVLISCYSFGLAKWAEAAAPKPKSKKEGTGK